MNRGQPATSGAARRRPALLFGLASWLFAAVAGAAPPDKAACANAYEKAQRLRRDHQLRASRDELLICARAECPGWVRRDCGPWLSDVATAIPSVVIVAHDADGAVRRDVRVHLDGERVVQELTGAPIELDPGPHVFVLEAGGTKIEQRLELREGERERRIDVTFPRPAKLVPPKPPAPVPVTRPVPALAIVLGGAGLALGAAGTVFELNGLSQRSALNACEPRCVPSDVDSARTTLWVGNILLGASVLSLAGAAWVFFTRDAVPARATGVRFDVAPTHAGVAGVLSGRF